MADAPIDEKVDKLQNSVDRIEQALIGDKFNQKGVIQIQQDQEVRIAKIEVSHKQNKWLRGVAVTAFGIITAICGFLIKIYSE